VGEAWKDWERVTDYAQLLQASERVWPPFPSARSPGSSFWAESARLCPLPRTRVRLRSPSRCQCLSHYVPIATSLRLDARSVAPSDPLGTMCKLRLRSRGLFSGRPRPLCPDTSPIRPGCRWSVGGHSHGSPVAALLRFSPDNSATRSGKISEEWICHPRSANISCRL
jgi:hypothetical protein